MQLIFAPGQTNDAVACKATGLHEIIDKLPSGLFIAGDAAYMLTEHLLFPSQDLAGKTLTINHFKFLPGSS